MQRGTKMRIIILLLSTIVLLTSCNKGSDSAAATTDPVFGSWSYIAPGATATVFTGYAGILKEDGNVTLLSMKAYDNGVTPVVYYRKNIGKFVRTGDSFKITYSYETCNPMGSETINLKYSNTQLLMSAPPSTTIVAFSRMATSYDPVENLTMIEDTACNKF